MAIQLKTYCDYVTDGGWSKMDLYYIRDKQKREVDFLITKDEKPLLLIEAKKSQKGLDKHLIHFSKQLGNIPALQVAQKSGLLIKHEPHIWSVSVNRFLNHLWLST